MFISVCVIAYNEEKAIGGILKDILEQDYSHENMELLLVDSASTDSTKSIMQEFAGENRRAPDGVRFRSVRLLDNSKRILPCGWNVALAAYEGEAILKVDAHASIPKDFVSKNVAALMRGENIVGGRRPNIIEEDTDWRRTLLLAEESMFGAGIAPYRNNPGKCYVKSLFHAAYRRCVFDTVGGFNEQLARTEDNEIHYRMRKAGFCLLFDPDIVSYQHTRSSLPKMLRQKYANGYWIGLTAGVCPACLSIYHFVPFLFVLAVVLSVPGIIVNALLFPDFLIVGWLTAMMWGMYGLLNLGMSVLSIVCAKGKRGFTCIALPILFLLLHFSYGIGTLVGFIRMPLWLKGIRGENGRDEKG